MDDLIRVCVFFFFYGTLINIFLIFRSVVVMPIVKVIVAKVCLVIVAFAMEKVAIW